MPILPSVEISLTDTIPEIIDTNINGSTIIFNKIKNKEATVESMSLIMNVSMNVLGSKKILMKRPKTIPNSIELKIFFVKDIKLFNAF